MWDRVWKYLDELNEQGHVEITDVHFRIKDEGNWSLRSGVYILTNQIQSFSNYPIYRTA